MSELDDNDGDATDSDPGNYVPAGDGDDTDSDPGTYVPAGDNHDDNNTFFLPADNPVMTPATPCPGCGMVYNQLAQCMDCALATMPPDSGAGADEEKRAPPPADNTPPTQD